MKLKLKGGGCVDPDSKLEHKTHVVKVCRTIEDLYESLVFVETVRSKFSTATQELQWLIYIQHQFIYFLQKKETLYSVVLGAVSIQDDKNSYYKLQVLEHDKKPKVDLYFRSI